MSKNKFNYIEELPLSIQDHKRSRGGYNPPKSRSYFDINSSKKAHNKHKFFISYAKSYAFKSPLRWKYAAIIINQNKIISVGYNHSKLSTLSGLYSTHAEIDAIYNCKDKKLLRNAIMYVVHVNTNQKLNDEYALGAPCHDCEIKLLKCMNKYGLCKVYYTMATSY